jgi:hypothetical protein
MMQARPARRPHLIAHAPIVVAAVSAAGWTISVIAILIVAVIAWRVFGGRDVG